MIETNIQRQQDELRQIQDELQRVQGQSLQMFLQKGAGGLSISSVQMAQGNAVQQGGMLSMQGQVVSAGPLQNNIQQQHATQPQSQQQTLLRDQSTALSQSQRSSLTLQPQQNPLSASLYNTMMIPQQSPTNMVQIATSLAQNTGPNTPAVATFAQDRAAQIRFPAGPQLLTKLVTGQMACGAVMVPTTMFMGQVVTAFAPQQGQTQTISISQQPSQQQHQQQEQQVQQQSQVTAMQPGHTPLAQQQTQFLQAPRLLHGNQSTQLILQAAFPLQQQGTFTATAQQQQQQLQQQQQQQHHQQQKQLQQQKQQLAPHRADSLSDRSATQPQ